MDRVEDKEPGPIPRVVIAVSPCGCDLFAYKRPDALSVQINAL